MSALTFPPIKDLMPHREPMILIERMVDAGEASGACELNIHPQSPFCGNRGVPAYVGLEYMAQAVSAFTGLQRRRAGLPVLIGFLLGTPELRSSCQIFPVGQRLRIEVEHVWGEKELGRFACAIKDAHTGETLQTAGLSVFQPSNPQQLPEKIGL